MRIESGIATLPMSWSSAARADASRTPAGEAEALGDGVGQLGDAVEVVAELRMALGEHADQHVAGLALGDRARVLLCAYMRWSASRSASVGVVASLGIATPPMRARDRRSLALLAQRAASAAR